MLIYRMNWIEKRLSKMALAYLERERGLLYTVFIYLVDYLAKQPDNDINHELVTLLSESLGDPDISDLT